MDGNIKKMESMLVIHGKILRDLNITLIRMDIEWLAGRQSQIRNIILCLMERCEEVGYLLERHIIIWGKME